MTKKAPNREADNIAKLEAWLATKKGPIETAAYNDAKKLLENAWKPDLQSALKSDVYENAELRRKIEASILKLPEKGAVNPDADSSRVLENHVVAILTAAAFERFATNRSQTPAGKRATESEIKTLAKLSARLVIHLEGFHQTSRDLVEETLPLGQLQLLKRIAKSVADASKNVRTRPADVPFREKSSGRKVNGVAESVTRTAAIIFKRRTGQLPGRTTDRISGKTGGPFIAWLAELFSLLKIDVSADAEARKYLARTMDKTQKK